MAGEVWDTLSCCRVLDLEQPRRAGDPTHPAHAPGLNLYLHRRHEPGLGEPRTSASGLIVAAEHSGTHIDALCHQAEGLRLFGGIEVTSQVQMPTGFSRLGIETIEPILAPGVLLDVASLRGGGLPEGTLITKDDLAACEEAQGLNVGPGQVVLIRTGYGQHWQDAERYLRAPGIAADGAWWLAERGVLAVGADSVAFDAMGHVDPDLGCTLPCHVILLVRHGIYIIENLNLEELARIGQHRFAFICLPLKITGGTGCPVRPVALVV
jgi:kynurenine formamidase